MSGVKKSLAKAKVVHGITIKRLAIGAYVSALEGIGELPTVLLEKLYPSLPFEQSLLLLKRIDARGALELICKAVRILPDEIFGFLSRLLDVPLNVIKDELTPKELMEILSEFWTINELSDFIRQAKAVVMSVK